MQADYYLIKLARFEKGWTQEDLADAARLAVNTIRKAERGGSISPVTHGKIKRALGLK